MQISNQLSTAQLSGARGASSVPARRWHECGGESAHSESRPGRERGRGSSELDGGGRDYFPPYVRGCGSNFLFRQEVSFSMAAPAHRHGRSQGPRV